MKKLASALIAATALVLGTAPSGEAGGFRGHHGFKGGVKSHHGVNAGFGFKGHGGLHPGFGLRSGFKGHGVHGFHHRFGFHGHPGFGAKIFIGAPLHGHYGFRSSPYVSARAFPEQGGPNYVQREEAVWYYCEGARAYYPDVQECPGGWVTVTPPASISPAKESWE